MEAHMDKKAHAPRSGKTAPPEQDRQEKAQGAASRLGSAAGSNGMSAAQAIGLQKLIGNRAVAQLMQNRTQPPHGENRGAARTGTGGKASPPMQLRVIDHDIYSEYDENKAKESTKLLFLAAEQEDSLIAWEQAAKLLLGRIKSLRSNEMVKDKAEAGLEAMTVKLGEISTAKATAVSEMTKLIQAYQTHAKPPVIRKGGSGSARDRLRVIAELRANADNTVKRAIQGSADLVQEGYTSIQVKHGEMDTFVTRLQQEASDKKKGKSSFEKLQSAHGTASEQGGLFEMAKELRIEVPESIHELQLDSSAKAGDKQWIEAGESASKGSAQLEKLRNMVDSAAANKRKYEEQLKELPFCLQVKGELERLKIKDGGELTDMLDARKDAMEDARNQNWAGAKDKALKAMRLARKLDGLADRFRNYSRTGGVKDKLLAGSIREIFIKLNERPSYTNEEALEYMQDIYEQQCAVSRYNWLTFLGIAGNIIVGSDSNHFTTFNDSVPMRASFTVYNQTAADLCDELFGVGNEMLRLHSTRVVGAERYHRYWQTSGQADPIYSANVTNDDLANTNPTAYGELNARYGIMRRHMMKKVEEAIELHGRVGTNDRGQQLTYD
ncbi:hypothetical protein [Paenibacillus sp. R14(2021)]|uniref:hypothetical protein n=1 Tax=Paenibacillus sp. R14(2021) TaxID=2859228 RepID=UPI001C612752|nr:hypothetical protein [Paenibacillus sp. R14(2021)]